MRVQSRYMAGRTELEAMRKDFAELESVHEARCAHSLHLEGVVAELTEENEGLKKD